MKPRSHNPASDQPSGSARQQAVSAGHRGVVPLLAPNVCCVDVSVAKSGRLVAYRYGGGLLRTGAFVADALGGGRSEHT